MYEHLDHSAVISMITIYRHPRDYPDHHFVARVWFIMRDQDEPQAAPDLYATGRTLEEIRRKLPRGMYRLAREPNDDPAILETWV